jgi:hypothetical protein
MGKQAHHKLQHAQTNIDKDADPGGALSAAVPVQIRRGGIFHAKRSLQAKRQAVYQYSSFKIKSVSTFPACRVLKGAWQAVLSLFFGIWIQKSLAFERGFWAYQECVLIDAHAGLGAREGL